MEGASKTRWVYIGVAVILLLILMYFQYYHPKRPAATTNKGGGRDTTLECPDHNLNLPVGAGDSTSVTVVPVAGVITNIPEFHDCQRLLSEQNPDRYGPLAGVWVSYRLDSLLNALPKHNEGAIRPPTSGGGIVAPHGFEPGVSPWEIIPGAPRTGVMLAQVYAWDGDYRPLGMKQGWNCLYFFPDNTPSGLAALMVPVADVRKCPDFVDTGGIKSLAAATPQPLFVATTGPSNLHPGAFPPVGRWDWDARSHTQYLGIGCGRSWCEVTREQVYTPSVAYPLTAGTEPELRRRMFEVKGWYDEQRLALHNTNMGDAPAAFHGVAIPDTMLDLIDDPSGFEGQWISAAWATVGLPGETVDPKYETNFNFRPGDLRDPHRPVNLSHVFMCQGKVEQCFPQGSNTAPPRECNAQPGWWARIESPEVGGTTGPATKYACVGRVDHSSLAAPHIPGTARWFWLKDDEKLWMRCAQGCCTLN